MTSSSTASGAAVEQLDHVPARAAGVELLGELPGSGYRTPPALARRGDGQTVQLSRLLHLVLEHADGTRTYGEVAEEVSAAYGRRLTGEQVRELAEGPLRRQGLLLGPGGAEPEVRKRSPLLGLRLRYVVTDPALTRRITAPFAALFHPALVVALTLGFAATAWWVLLEKGLAAAAYDAFDRPVLLLLVFAVTAVSAGFHELGHAAACRYGGATPGAMGTGLYLVWPAFYTDVTDSYRLGRGGRLRVDLGGLYFNAVVSVLMLGLWAVTGWEAWLLVIATQVLQMVRQLAPFVRFDGYHVLADLTGVPDLYSRIGPVLRSVVPGRSDPRASALRPWARVVVTAWVLVVVPVLLVSLVLMVVSLPRVAATAWESLQRQVQGLGSAWETTDLAEAGVRVLSVVAIALPVAASVYLIVRVVRQAAVRTWAATRGHPVRRGVAAAVAACLLAGTAWAWWPDGDTYRPIRPDERGALTDVLPGPGAPVRPLREGALRSAERSVWASPTPPPTRDDPALALVLVPRGGASPAAAAGAGPSSPAQAGAASDGTAWVFPFDRPDAPREGDTQALAVNTTDGSRLYDVAFAMVWVTDGSYDTRNEAYAVASCTGCTTVAVAFQVVLVVGQADVAVPQNYSVAVNYSCVECLTYALATQLVLTLPGEPAAQTVAGLQALWAEIQQFGASLEDVPLDQLRARLVEYERRILEVLRSDPGVRSSSPSASPTAAPSPSPSGEATPSGSPTASAPAAPGDGDPSTTQAPTGSTAGTAPPSRAPSPTGTSPASAPAASAPSPSSSATSSAATSSATATATPGG